MKAMLLVDLHRPENQADAGFLIGKRSADNARRFMFDIAGRLVFPNAHASDARDYRAGGYSPVVADLHRLLCGLPRSR